MYKHTLLVLYNGMTAVLCWVWKEHLSYHAHLDNMARLNGSLETQIYTFFIILYVLYESDTTILMMMKSRRRRLRESP